MDTREKWYSPTSINFIEHIVFTSERKISGSRNYCIIWITFISISLVLKRYFFLYYSSNILPFLLQLQSKSSSVPIRNTRSIENIYTLHPWLQFKFAPESDASNPAGIPRQSFPEFLHENDGGGGCGWHRMGSDNKTRSPPLR